MMFLTVLKFLLMECKDRNSILEFTLVLLIETAMEIFKNDTFLRVISYNFSSMIKTGIAIYFTT